MDIILNPPVAEWPKLAERNIPADDDIARSVQQIVSRVRRQGDAALYDFARQFDGAELDTLEVTQAELQQAEEAVAPEVKQAMQQAARNIRAFHAAQLPEGVQVETQQGVVCEQHAVAIQRVGLYIPGGRAPLFSTVLMLALPAKIAGCPEVVLCTPQGRSGHIAPEILCAARLCGIDRVFRVGGAQAVAAMAYGTESIPRVDKIFGPGNRYVTKAKQLVQNQVAIDMPAGPSEVLVMSDDSARPDFVAADMLSQAEHGPDSQAMLVCHSAEFARQVEAEVERQADRLSRSEAVAASLAHSRIVVLDSEDDRIAFANQYAAEHLIIATRSPRSIAARITAAGSIFLGHYSPESAGDYASGTTHTRPTGSWARAYSGVNIDSFQRKITWQELSPAGLAALAPTITTMAQAEGLDAHAAAVTVRLGEAGGCQAGTAAVEQSATTITEVLSWVRPNIRQLAPYSTARDECRGGSIHTWLDANESPYDNGVNRYPDPHQQRLKQAIAQLKGVQPDQLFVGGAGSDEAIDLTFRIFCEPGIDNAVAIAPSYGVYQVAADTNHVALRTVPLGPDYSLPAEALLKAADPHTRLLWICSPNNPTGNAFDTAELEQLADRFRGMVVVDEAYVDFSPRGSMLQALQRHPNLIVLQTFSKAWGMASLRLGMAFAAPEVAALYAKVKYPYNVNGPTQEAVLRRISQGLLGEVEEICAQRSLLAEALPRISCVQKVYPTDANFFLIRVADPDALYDYLVSQGVMVRNRHRVAGCEGCLRITIGTPDENRRLLDLLRRYGHEAEAAAAREEQPATAGCPLKRALFIDRDGTLIREPADEQIDSLEKLEFVPGMISALRSIAQLDYELVMVSNQDGLGTASFPEETFHPAHNKLLDTLAGEGIHFAAQHIDRTFPADGAPTRKPGTAMLTAYMQGDYDLAHSYVIGDRLTDVELAHNLGARALWLGGDRQQLPDALRGSLALATPRWSDLAEYLRRTERRAEVRRQTAETRIRVQVDLDGELPSHIHTGLHFFDHMLSQLPHHAGIGLDLRCAGDLEVDEHHTMEDVALALGEALRRALGSKLGIGRYGFVLPMDDARATVLLDLGGRADFSWHVPFSRDRVGDTPTEMYRHFFQSLSTAMQCNLQVEAEGENNHHLIEGVFKAFARALRQAISRNVFKYELPSSKGTL